MSVFWCKIQKEFIVQAGSIESMELSRKVDVGSMP